jgi:hypothetical protein
MCDRNVGGTHEINEILPSELQVERRKAEYESGHRGLRWTNSSGELAVNTAV